MLGRVAALTCLLGGCAQAALEQVPQCAPDDGECLAGLQETDIRMELLQQTFKKHNSEGTFEYLTNRRPEEGACDVRGSWNQDGETIHMASNDTAVELGAAGHRLALLSTPGSSMSYWRFDGAVVDSKPWADQPSFVQQGMAGMMSAMAGREHTLSSALGARGLDGKSMPCAYKLHMLLLTMSKKATNPYATPSSWGGYKFGVFTGCPVTAPSDWTCRIERVFGSNDAWSRPPQDYSSAHSSWVQDVKCKPDPGKDVECTGLCGKTCDCWESICGANYGCDYNPVCCAHDRACDEFGFLSSECANAVQVQYACSDDGLQLKPR
mmetsp:Transcript_86492/g.268754  ORF Transcript_86492/g.268754 Transcript_86492/m.268754 type:complete len:323 (-) Transcript_86492:145-1113(-)